MHTLKLRRYQTEAIAAAQARLEEHTRTAIVLPTGMGKTVVFSHLIAQTIELTGKRVLVMVHRDELAEQAKSKVESVAPEAKVGIVKAGRNEVDGRDVIVASVQTLARARRREALGADSFGLIIVDECHHAAARTWLEVLDFFGGFRAIGEAGRTPVVGFTATMAREDGRALGNVWESVAYERTIEYGIEHGHLVDVRGQQVTVDGLDLATIAKSRGDYQDGALGDALEASGAGEVIAEAYQEHAAGKRGILFAPTVSSAEAFAEAMNAAGIVTEVVIGTTSKEDRELIYKKFRNGDVQVLSNCMVLTEGFDAPHAEVAVIARPTQSAALYTQMVGRVLRPFPGKDEALVLDVVGITSQHRLKSLTDLTTVEVEPGESITEAQERVAKEHEEGMERTRITGVRKAREVEMFASSHSVWLQTKGGTWFIPLKGGSIVLFSPDGGGRWSVGRKMQREAGEWLMKGLDSLEVAMAWGEQIAGDLDPMLAEKGRAWRKTKPSDAQMDLAARLRLAPVEELATMRRGALSDLLSVHFASRDLKALDTANEKARAAVAA